MTAGKTAQLSTTMNISPQPGDRWSLKGDPDIEVLVVKGGKVRYVQAEKPGVHTLAEFERLARNSIKRGAVLRRGEETFSPLEDFEI